MMLGSTRAVRVWVRREPTDMRKAYNTLSAVVAAGLGQNALSGDVYVFIGKDRKRCKALYWDGTGLCILSKRLEQGKFYGPWLGKRPSGSVCWTLSELSLFLEGSEVVGRMALSPEAYEPKALGQVA